MAEHVVLLKKGVFIVFVVFLLGACATVVAWERLYSRWATGPLFFHSLDHMLEKVKNCWCGRQRVLMTTQVTTT